MASSSITTGDTSTPAISVCVTAYNYAKYLSTCIESVLSQTFTDWELVIVDDNSTDETADIVSSFQSVDSRIKYIRNPTNIGMAANLKRAADACEGRYIKVLCADDWIAPTCLEMMYGAMEAHPEVVLATSAEVNSDEHGRPLRIAFLYGKPLSVVKGNAMLDRMGLGSGMGGNSSFFVRSSALRSIGGYDENVLYGSDYDLAARLCKVGDYLHLDAPLFFGRNQPQSSRVINRPKLLDVHDAFSVPDKIFRPRPRFSRNWLRYHNLKIYQTSRYLTVAVSQYVRGNREYALRLLPFVLRNGSVLLGVLILPGYLIWRIGKKASRAIIN